MGVEVFDALVYETFVLVVLLSGAPLFVSAAVGIVISTVQTATQLQEQTVLFVGKLIGVLAVLFLFSGWAMSECIEYVHQSFALIVYLGRASP